MSEASKKVGYAAQVVTNSLAATVSDLESGIGSFFSGTNARNHEAAPVREPAKEREQESPATDTTAGQIVANQQIGGKDYYLVQTENQKGEPERALFEKGSTDYQAGKDVTVTWGSSGTPASAKADNGQELPWGGGIAGKSQFSEQSQFASTYHDENDKGL